MKKRIFLSMILAAVMLATVLAGCGSGGSAAQKEEPAAAESTQEEAAPAETTAEDAAAETESTEAATTSAAAEENTGRGKPRSDVRSAEEAAKGAGIDSFVIAEDPGLDLGQLFERTYRCMDGIAEARLEYPASALTVRKGTKAEEGDISGDYTEYANT